MSNYRGQDGLLILGGELIGTPKARAAVATGVTEFAVTGGGTMTGLVTVGDIFAIDGGTDYTVAGSFYVVSTNAIATLVFAPAVATAIASNATLTRSEEHTSELQPQSNVV